jgi:amino acid transporter
MICLGLATLLAAPRFIAIQGPMGWLTLPLLVFFLVLIAFLADRITFDCTSINEADASSGVGLLQSLGLNKAETYQKSKELQSRPGAYLKPRKKHNPGVWVLYFALMVLPLFGLGQFFIRDVASRTFSHRLLFVYLFCTLSLLVLISLLSLRKYLREREIEMELPFAIRWLSIGIAAVSALLIVFALLPIPNQSLWSWELPVKITNRDDMQAHRMGWGNEGVEDKNDVPPGAQNGEQPDAPNGDEGKPAKEQNNAAGKPGEGKPIQDEQGNGDQGAKGGEAEQGQNDQQQGKKSERNNDDNPSERRKEPNLNSSSEQKNSNDGQPGETPKNQSQQAEQNKGGEQAKRGDQAKGAEQSNGNERSEGKEQGKGDGNPREKDGGQKQPGNQQPNDQQPNQQPDKQDAGQPPKAQEPPQNQPPPAPPPQSWSMQWNPGPLLQWLVVLVLLIIAVIFGIKYRKAIVDFFRNLLGRADVDASVDLNQNKAETAELFPPFLSFQNPFANRAMSTEQIVRQMFRALQSWGYERRVVRSVEETPDEYVRRLGKRYPEQMQNLVSLGSLYGRLAYARGKVASQELAPLQELWQWLASQR